MEKNESLDDVELVLLPSPGPPSSTAGPSTDILPPFGDNRALEEQQENPQTRRTNQSLSNHHKDEIGNMALCILGTTLFLVTQFVHDTQLPGARPGGVGL